MKAKFNDGPYDGVSLHMKDGLEHVRLPVKVSTAMDIVGGQKAYNCYATYQLFSQNDYESRFQFVSISAP